MNKQDMICEFEYIKTQIEILYIYCEKLEVENKILEKRCSK